LTTKHLIPGDVADLYEVHEWRNAAAILKEAHPREWDDLLAILREFRLWRSEILHPGQGRSPISQRLDVPFYDRGWKEQKFRTSIVVDDEVHDSPTHKVDCFRNGVGVEVEWNNKDPFYDRDLNNFRLLFELRALDVGVVITRCDELQTLFDDLGKGKSYGASTTHMGKLLPRLEGGSGGGCPILAFGIGRKLYVDR
jgi:hypothetical protein